MGAAAAIANALFDATGVRLRHGGARARRIGTQQDLSRNIFEVC